MGAIACGEKLTKGRLLRYERYDGEWILSFVALS
jgi:hypothetical protein